MFFSLNRFHKQAPYLLSGLLALLVFLAFVPALDNEFVNWDDNIFVYENEGIRTLGPELWRWIFLPFQAFWSPLLWLSHALVYHFSGNDPFGHHLANVLLHAANVFLFSTLAHRLCTIRLQQEPARERPLLQDPRLFAATAATFAALFWGLSPLRAESVAWVSERKDVLSLFFGLVTLICHTRYRFREMAGKKILGSYLTTLLFFCFSIMAKPMLVTLPLVFLILDYYPFARFDLKSILVRNREVLVDKIPFLLLAAGVTCLTVIGHEAVGGLYGMESRPLGTRLFLMVHSLLFYPGKTLLPVNLAPLYIIKGDAVSLLSGKFICGTALISLISCGCLFLTRQTRLYLAIWTFYVVTLLPVSGLVTVGSQAAADRYTYFPGLAFALLFGLAMARLLLGWRSAPPIGRWRQRAVCFFLIAFFSWQTMLLLNQVEVWHDPITLWTHQITLFPEQVSTPYTNRAGAYLKRGNYRQAITDFSMAVRLAPDRAESYANRGVALLKSGQTTRAISDFVVAAYLGHEPARRFLETNSIEWE